MTERGYGQLAPFHALGLGRAIERGNCDVCRHYGVTSTVHFMFSFGWDLFELKVFREV